VNAWQFQLDDALAIVSMLSKSGIPYIEVGYYRPRPAGNGDRQTGLSSYCSHEYLNALSRVRGDSKLTVMIHPGDVLPTDYTFLADHDISCVRFILSTANVLQLKAHIDAARAAGLLTSVNLIRASERSIENILTSGRAAEDLGVDWLYIADSNGSMFPERVELIFRELSSEVRLPLGFHAHDSLQLAFANSLAAIGAGGRLLDSSVAGMGKGAGNLVTELITAYLKSLYGVPCNVNEMTTMACQTLSPWIRGDHMRRCESTLSALLDLNADGLKEVVAAADRARRPLLAELESSLDGLLLAAASQPGR
jgi:4-hydroxy 2-oxovalerate aldolase